MSFLKALVTLVALVLAAPAFAQTVKIGFITSYSGDRKSVV